MTDFAKAGKKFATFCETVAKLRHPETGCPWDLEQDHESLQRFMIEEAYEAVAEMQVDGGLELAGELGDVLLQVVLNSQVAKDDSRFTIEEVLDSINQKMLRRHPHVFGSEEEQKKRDISSIKSKWQEIKESEKSQSSGEKGFYESHKIEKIFPASLQADKIGKLSKKIDFDWKDPQDCFKHFLSEVEELQQEITHSNLQQDPDLKSANGKVLDELADVYFTLAQVSRHLGVSPEVAAARGNEKFLKRFEKVEKIIEDAGLQLEDAGSRVLNDAWNKAKNLD